MVEGGNVGRLRPGDVCKQVNAKINENISASYHHRLLYELFEIRPKPNADDPFKTNTLFCHYDDCHGDYVYKPEWVDFVTNLFLHHGWTVNDLKKNHNSGIFFDPDEFMC